MNVPQERFPPLSMSPSQLAAAQRIWGLLRQAEPWVPAEFTHCVGVFGWKHGCPAPARGTGTASFSARLEAFVQQKGRPVVFAGDYMAGVGQLESALRSGLWAAGRLAGSLGGTG